MEGFCVYYAIYYRIILNANAICQLQVDKLRVNESLSKVSHCDDEKRGRSNLQS